MEARIKKTQNYDKIKILGEGTYGKCYLVNDIYESQLCVLKQIQIKGMNQEQVDETMKQARILQALDHPCIVKCLDAFVEDGFLNILMNYADAGDLSKKIKEAKGSQFNQSQILNWFTQMCLAMKHVHDRKIIHRDLKTQNIFLTSDGLIKLGDFGIAKPLQLTLQKIKTVVGTPYYMSPQICQNKEYSFKADIWSLGVILFQMCALKPPFDASSLPALALKISRGEYAALPSNYSKQLKKLVSQLLQVDTIKRPSINDVLKFPIIKNRIDNFLPRGIRQRQFSHTTLHSQNIFEREDLKNEISKIARDNTQLNSIISPRNGNKNQVIFINNTPQNKGSQFFSKFNMNSNNNKNPDKKVVKKHSEVRKRQISQPNITPKNFNSNNIDNKKSDSSLLQKKMKSNASLTNLQRKKSDKSYAKMQKPCFRKKKSNQKDIKSQISQIKELRSEVIDLHGQLSSRNNDSPQEANLNINSQNGIKNMHVNVNAKNLNVNVIVNNYIKEQIEQDQEAFFENSSESQQQQQIGELEQNQNVQKNLSNVQNQDYLASALETMLQGMFSQKDFSKNYQLIEQNNGLLNQQRRQEMPSEGLFSLLYALNTCQI